MQHFNNQKLVFSALCIALYIVVMMCTQTFAFGQYQIRIATALYGLSALFPFLVLPFGLANVISNTVMGGLGLPDIIGGGLVGVATTGLIVLAKRAGCGNWIVWLAPLLNLPYWLLASSLLVGQCISGIASFMLVSALERVGVGRFFAVAGGNNK